MHAFRNKRALIIPFLFICFTVYPQPKSQAYINYINTYSKLAVIQQKEHGIPASITLAQGLLESGAGQSKFAIKSNNHFGIKCHDDWTGDKIYHDDDNKEECFRKYDQVSDSYEDHSMYIKNKSRYAFLFNLSPTDYEGWAHGLKKAGYATDPVYAYKLISIIENYELHSYDLSQNIDKNGVAQNSTFENNVKDAASAPIGNIAAIQVHQVLKNNHVRYIITLQGDTYESIADEFNISEKNLRAYNEITESTPLKPGTQLYLQYKKSKAGKAYPTHIIREGETMYQIAQTYAIKTEKLYLLNQMPFSEGAKTGRVLKLR